MLIWAEGECDIPGSDIGEIEVFENYSFFNAASKHKNRILSKMKNARIKGQNVVIELSNEKRSRRVRSKSKR